MLTFFATPKPFRGHIGIIQRNALESWRRLAPGAEIILFGNEEGAAEAAHELGIRHVPDVARNEHGTKYLSPIFDRAQELARHDHLCYINCDIVLLSDFGDAVRRVAGCGQTLLMVGQRWDTDITTPLDFSRLDWQDDVRQRALAANKQRPRQWIDYFVFSRGLYYRNTPPFVIGRPGWDNWLLWRARTSRALVVDASAVVVAVHQNHDYAHHPDGERGVWQGAEAQQNYALLDRGRRHATMANATHRLTGKGLRRNWRHWPEMARRKSWGLISAVWFALLDLTRPIRRCFGLDREKIAAFLAKDR